MPFLRFSQMLGFFINHSNAAAMSFAVVVDLAAAAAAAVASTAASSPSSALRASTFALKLLLAYN